MTAHGATRWRIVVLLTKIALRPLPVGGAPLDAEVVVDLLWLNTAASDGVKHIHVRVGPDVVNVVAFTVASEQAISDYVVARICERAIRTMPALAGWRICTVNL